MQSCLAAGVFYLGIRCLRPGNPNISGNRIAKQLRFLSHIAFHRPQIGGINGGNISIRNRNVPGLNLPKSHKKFKHRRFAAAGLAHHPNNPVFRKGYRQTVQNFFFAIGKAYIAALRSGKGNRQLSGNIFRFRRFIQNRQYPRSRSNG